MGARAAAIAALGLAAGLAAAARADELTCEDLDHRGRPFVTCFDPGNRLLLGAGADPDGAVFEGGLHVRHYLPTDEPSITWRFEHALVSAAAGQGRFDAVLYAGRFLRHSRDGHLVLPTEPPRKIFLPFDVGVEVTVGRARGLVHGFDLLGEVMRAVALLDLARSSDFRRRLSLGTVVAWDVAFARDPLAVLSHRVVPFSTGQLAAYAEDRRGLTRAGVTLEGGTRWSTVDGWGPQLSGAADVERVFLAINDRPLSLFVEGRWDRDEGLIGRVGLRMALVGSARTTRPP